MTDKKRLLFVCVGNAARSQMAEGFARRHGADGVEVRSAGTHAAGLVSGPATEAMAEKGVDISSHRSDQITDDLIKWAQVVVTVGCEPAEDICPPDYPGRKLHWDVPDPLFRPPGELPGIRDDIERRVKELLEELAGE